MSGWWTIRPLTHADLADYRAVRLESLRLHPRAYGSSYDEESAYTFDDFAARWPTPPGIMLGGFSGERLVGIAGLVVSTRLKQRHKGAIHGLYVAPGERGRGLARALIEATIAAARAARLVYVSLHVTIGNDSARWLYERLGFRAVGIEPRGLLVDGEYVDEVLMVLDLDQPEAA